LKCSRFIGHDSEFHGGGSLAAREECNRPRSKSKSLRRSQQACLCVSPTISPFRYDHFPELKPKSRPNVTSLADSPGTYCFISLYLATLPTGVPIVLREKIASSSQPINPRATKKGATELPAFDEAKLGLLYTRGSRAVRTSTLVQRK